MRTSSNLVGRAADGVPSPLTARQEEARLCGTHSVRWSVGWSQTKSCGSRNLYAAGLRGRWSRRPDAGHCEKCPGFANNSLSACPWWPDRHRTSGGHCRQSANPCTAMREDDDDCYVGVDGSRAFWGWVMLGMSTTRKHRFPVSSNSVAPKLWSPVTNHHRRRPSPVYSLHPPNYVFSMPLDSLAISLWMEMEPIYHLILEREWWELSSIWTRISLHLMNV